MVLVCQTLARARDCAGPELLRLIALPILYLPGHGVKEYLAGQNLRIDEHMHQEEATVGMGECIYL